MRPHYSGFFQDEPYLFATWIAAFGTAGGLCVFNAIRSGRFHCFITGPVFLAGALATNLRFFGVLSWDWKWIGIGVIVGTVSALFLERIKGAACNHCS